MNKVSGSLHLTKKVDYGLFLLAILADKNSPAKLSIKTIAEKSHISFPFLQKVARLLQKAKIIHAERGKYGGYSLKKKAEKLNLLEIIEALDGPIALTSCMKKGATKDICERIGFCKIRKGLCRINEKIQKEFLSKSLTDIIE